MVTLIIRQIYVLSKDIFAHNSHTARDICPQCISDTEVTYVRCHIASKALYGSVPDGGVDNALLLLICFVRNPDLLCRKSVLPCWKSEWLCGAPPDLIKIRSGATFLLCNLPLCDMESIGPMGPMESTSM